MRDGRTMLVRRGSRGKIYGNSVPTSKGNLGLCNDMWTVE